MSAADLDRLAPTRRPADREPSGQQRWRNLLFLHWSVDVSAMRRAVPAELELDLWDGRALIGLVPFEMEGIRPAWLPGPLAMDFLETNLRTYVHHRGEPGVYFFSLEASSRLAVQAARWGWSLPYHYADMSTANRDGTVSYRSTRGSDANAMVSVDYRIGDPLGPAAPGTLEHFLLERYYLFALRRGRVTKGHVHHPPYPAQRAEILSLEQGLIRAAGFEHVTSAPEAVHFAAGVDVDVFGPWPVT